MPQRNALYFGDNLQVLREQVPDASVDLVYLDPPFNSKRDYNVLFKTPKPQKARRTGNGETPPAAEQDEPEYGYSEAQITAFEDTWHWGQQAEDEFREILQQPNTEVAELMRALRSFLKENDMMAYLTAMCLRLLELHRVLKPTGSLYLHCDPTASHYLKVVLDGVFGADHFVNEIVWKRTSSKSDHAQGASHWPRVHDVILCFARSLDQARAFAAQFAALDDEYVAKKYPHIDSDGRRFGLWDMTGPGGAAKGNPEYEVLGVTRFWRYSRTRMQQMLDAGLVVQPRPGAVPREKRFLDQSKGVVIGDTWTDIAPINSQADERLGYPTQKPLALLERIIAASSNEGDVVLDPFCGCGTAVHAAQKLNRRWIGIDITHLAVGLIERRLKDAFPGIVFDVIGTPRDLAAARELAERDKHQFQLWACGLVNAQPYQGGRRGADRGIDGKLFIEVGKKTEKVIVQVKGGANVSRANIATLKGDVDREKAAVGLFVTLAEPTKDMVKEAAAGHYESPYHGAVPKIQILTVEELLAGKKPVLPDLSRGSGTFRKAKREERDAKKAQTDLGF